MWTENFESTIGYPPWFKQGDYSTFAVSSDYSVNGSSSWKSIMPAVVHTNPRNEILHNAAAQYNGVEGQELNLQVYTKKVAVYFPSDYNFDSSYTYPSTIHFSTIFQYHGFDGGTSRTQPSLPLYEDNGNMRMWNNWSDVYLGVGQNNVKLTNPNTGSEIIATITKGSWHYFHLEVLWDWRQLADGGTGYVKLYLSKTGWPNLNDIIVDYSGPTGYNDPGGAYFKIGIYKWNWRTLAYVEDAKAVGCDEVVRYYDEYTNAKGTLSLGVPIANAGSDQSISVATTTLDGTQSSDSDGTIVSYLWEQVSGPNAANILTPSGSSSIVNGLIVGDYVFRLTVTDNDSLTDTDEVTITVNPIISTNKANARVLL